MMDDTLPVTHKLISERANERVERRRSLTQHFNPTTTPVVGGELPNSSALKLWLDCTPRRKPRIWSRKCKSKNWWRYTNENQTQVQSDALKAIHSTIAGMYKAGTIDKGLCCKYKPARRAPEALPLADVRQV